MILSSKQLEELEHLHDSVSEFDDEANVGSDNEEFDEASEGALAWRRGMLERAASIVRKFEKSPLHSRENYAIGTLVYDTLNNRFARVKESNTTQALLVYVSGGEAILKGAAIQITQALKTATGPAKKKTEPKAAAKKPAAKPVVTAKPKAAAKKPETKKPATSKAPAKKVEPKKTAAKKPAPKKPIAQKPVAQKAAAKKPAAKKPVAKKPVAKKPAPKKAAEKKPVNPNTFIKQNYKKMSNKELAGVTGLSEHTIRRKLGEWGLKRPGK